MFPQTVIKKQQQQHTDLTHAEPLLIAGDGLGGVFCTVSPKMLPCLLLHEWKGFSLSVCFHGQQCLVRDASATPAATNSLIAISHRIWYSCFISPHPFITEDMMRALNDRFSLRVASLQSLHIIITHPHRGTCRHALDYRLISIIDWTGWKKCNTTI